MKILNKLLLIYFCSYCVFIGELLADPGDHLTVVVHGFSPPVTHPNSLSTFWYPLCSTIATEENGHYRIYDRSSHRFETNKHSGSPNNNSTDHIVLFYDWNEETTLRDFSSGFVEAAAQQLLAALMADDYFENAETVTFIGYSRGATLVSETVERLLSMGLEFIGNPDRKIAVHYLDPHDWGTSLFYNPSDPTWGGNTPCNQVFNDMNTNSISFNPDCSDTGVGFAFFDDPNDEGQVTNNMTNIILDTRPNTGVVAWRKGSSNIKFFAFYQINDDSDFTKTSGRPVVNARNVEIRASDYSASNVMNHDNIILWYTKTVADPKKYVAGTADSGGYYYAATQTGITDVPALFTFDPPLETPNRTPRFSMHHFNEGIFNGSFGKQGTEFNLSESIDLQIPGWDRHGGVGPNVIKEEGFIKFIELTNNESRSTNYFYFPDNMHRIIIRVKRFTNGNGKFKVFVRELGVNNFTEIFEDDVNDLVNHWATHIDIISAGDNTNPFNAFLGKSIQIKFEVDGVGTIGITSLIGEPCGPGEECRDILELSDPQLHFDLGSSAPDPFYCKGVTKMTCDVNLNHSFNGNLAPLQMAKLVSPNYIYLGEGFGIGDTNIGYFTTTASSNCTCIPVPGGLVSNSDSAQQYVDSVTSEENLAPYFIVNEIELEDRIYPNPVFSDLIYELRVTLDIKDVTITLSDIQGRKVKTLIHEPKLSAGYHKWKFNLEPYANGSYLISLIHSEGSIVSKVIKE